MSEDPFGKLFDQLAGLLRLIQEKSGTPIDESTLSPQIYKQLKKLEKKVKAFEQLSADIVAMSNVSQEELQKRLQGISSDIPEHAKQILEKGRRLQADLNIVKDSLPPPTAKGNISTPSSSSNPVTSKIPSKSDFEKTQEMGDSKFGQKRKRKFKSFGEKSI